MLILYLILGVFSLLYFYVKRTYSYWERVGFPFVEPKIPFGALDTLRSRQHSHGTAIWDVYKKHKDRFIGIYLITRPALLIRDASLARDVLAKDFASFHNRGIYVDEEHDPFSAHLFALEGQKWKSLRNKLTPLFTSSKLKAMFTTVEDTANKMIKYLETRVPKDGTSVKLDMKELFSCYAVDIISSVFFGLEVNSFENSDNEMYRISRTLNNTPDLTSVIRSTTAFLYPNLEKFFNRIGWTQKVYQNMHEITKATINHRENHNVLRRDMLQLLLQLRNTGMINEDNDVWSVETAAESLKEMSVESITAQLVLFYAAGSGTTRTTTAFTMYELAKNAEILSKAQEDVDQALEKHGGFTYEAIQDMKYLDFCVKETVRKYPGLPILNRECTADYKIPDSKYTIPKGTPIIISLLGIHRDPAYFPNPNKYDPDRFLEDNKNYDPVAYMPFGEGPRHCIAQRMGTMNVKVALAKILSHFKIEVNEEMQEIEFENFGIVLISKGGIPIRLARK